MQNLRGEGPGKEGYPILGELPAKSIDTGMGLERVAFLLQGVDNMYEIDEIFPVIQRVEQLSGRRYGAQHDADVRMRVIADHVRSALMLIGDGVTPSNEARGYVLRRILRRVGARRPAARGRGPDPGRPGDGLEGPHEGLLPRARGGLRPDQRDRRGRGGVVPSDPHRRHHHPRHRGADHQGRGRHHPGGRAGFPAARHLRVPDRPDPRDGGRTGSGGRRGRVPAPDGRAAQPGQGRCSGQEDRPCRHQHLPRRRRPAGWTGAFHRLRGGRQRGECARADRGR